MIRGFHLVFRDEIWNGVDQEICRLVSWIATLLRLHDSGPERFKYGLSIAVSITLLPELSPYSMALRPSLNPARWLWT